MKFRSALRIAARAARVNLLPGLLLQALMVVFLTLYLMHDGSRTFLAHVADLKHQTGYLFAFVSYVFSAALLPELLRIVFFQKTRILRKNLTNFFTAAPVWGLMGVLVDAFYRLQEFWFGAGSDGITILIKMLVDQFLFSPFLASPLLVAYFLWRDSGFQRATWTMIFRRDFFFNQVFPVQVAGWCIWIPGVSVVYFMPSHLQMPVAALIQSFWVLVFTFVNRPHSRCPD